MRISNEMVEALWIALGKPNGAETRTYEEALAAALVAGGFKEETRPIGGEWHGEEARVAGPWERET